jgi:hypothetical protein
MPSARTSKTSPLFPASPRSLGELLADKIIADLAAAPAAEFTRYADDPRAFVRDVLGEEVTDDVAAVMESVRDNPVTIARSANGTGKTHAAGRIAVWFYKSRVGAQVYTAAAPPLENLSRLLWGEINNIVQRRPQLFAPDRVQSLNVQRNALEFITGVAIPQSGDAAQRKARFSGKHAPHLLFIVDEGDAIPAEIYEAIESCMSGGVARLLVMFNPRHEAGPVYLMERDRRAHVCELTAFNHPNVISGEDLIPGAVTREVTVRRINEWTRPLMPEERVDEECFEVPPFLVGATALSNARAAYPPLRPGIRKVTEPCFSYMVLGRYPSQSTAQLVSKAWIAAARARWDLYAAEYGELPPEGVRPVAGLDVAEQGADFNCLYFRSGGYVSRPVRWNGVDVLATAEKAAAICRARRALHCNVDGLGVGAGVAPAMDRAGVESYSIKVSWRPTFQTELGVFGTYRDELLWRVREWLRADPGAMLPPEERLLEELATPTYAVVNGVVKVTSKDEMKSLLRSSPDDLDALALTFAEDGVEQEESDGPLARALARRHWK